MESRRGCVHCGGLIIRIDGQWEHVSTDKLHPGVPPEPAETPTDTKRLDWMLAHLGSNCDAGVDKDGKPYCFISWWHESKFLVVRGKDYRECIDHALAGKAVEWK